MKPPEETKKELDQNPLLQSLGPPPILYEINLRKICDPVKADLDKLDLLKEPPPPKEINKNARISDVEVDVFRVYSSGSPVGGKEKKP